MKTRSRKPAPFDPARAAAALLAAATPEQTDIPIRFDVGARSAHLLTVGPALFRPPARVGARGRSFFGNGATDALLLNPDRHPDLSPDPFTHPLVQNLPSLAAGAAPAALRGYLDLIDAVLAMTQKMIPAMSVIARSPRRSNPIRIRLPRSLRSLAMTIKIPRPAYALAIIALIFIIPLAGGEAYARIATIRDVVAALGNDALSSAKDAEAAAATGDFAATAEALQKSAANFADARAELNEVSALARVFAPSAGRILEAGELLTTAAASFTATLENLKTSPNILFKVTELRNALENALPSVRRADDLLSRADANALPADHRKQFAELKHRVSVMRRALEDGAPLADSALALLGADEPRRYLIVFQNNAELRPTGGFIGSFAELTVRRGEIERLTVPAGGAYDLQGGLHAAIIPPEPIGLINPRWEFQDANWFPDFPASARKLQWFYEKSGGPTTDGVIAVNASLLPDLLKLLGPVTLPDGRLVTSENILNIINRSIDEAKDRGSRAPKQVISMLAPVLVERLLNLSGDQFAALPPIFGRALAEKKIMLALGDKNLAQALADRGWDGALRAPKRGDFLAVVHANIGGAKSDAVTDTEIFHSAAIQPDGAIIDTVTVKRTHEGPTGDHRLGRTNADYLRLYVPEGSELLSVSGDLHQPGEPTPGDNEMADPDLGRLEKEVGTEPQSRTRVTEEFGATVFGNWLNTPPGETKEITFSYRIPEKINLPSRRWIFGSASAPYTLALWRQSGADRTTIQTRVVAPPGFAARAPDDGSSELFMSDHSYATDIIPE